jgi:septal ring factor EnvC (AmiA/AmiB activator)
MSEVTDLLMPILQKIQADLAEVKRDLAQVKDVQEDHSQRFEDMEIYLAYATGLASQSKADSKSVKSEIRKIKQRLDSLETRP